MPPIYKWLYVAEGLAAVAFIAHLIQASAYLSGPNNQSGVTSLAFTLVFYHIPLAAAGTIGLITTWKYWGWLITERES
ncbi:MAG: hypothetical protein ACE5G8_08165 [Anaerolineae bacterium]